MEDIALLKLDAPQGEREVKDRWDDVQYRVIRQIVTDVPAYLMCDKGRNIKVVHQSGPFLVAPRAGDITSWGTEADLSDAMFNRSTLAGFTPLGCESESPADTAWGTLTQCLTGGMPLGWLGSI